MGVGVELLVAAAGLGCWIFAGVTILVFIVTVMTDPHGTLDEVIDADATATLLAVLLAAASWPFVAASMQLYSRQIGLEPTPLPPGDFHRYPAAGILVVLSALAGGSLGGLVVRRHTFLAGILAFLVSLWVAILALPLALQAAGGDLVYGKLCLDSCGALVDGSSFLAVALFPLAPLMEPVSVAALAAGVCVWTWLLRGRAEG